MSITEKMPVAKKVCPVIFILDTSLSMSDPDAGVPIGALNSTMENILSELEAMDKNNSYADIKVAVLTFSDEAKWLNKNLLTPKEIKDSFKQLEAKGLTSMGAAFKELKQKLSVSRGFMQNAAGFTEPVLFLLSDGEPTDDWEAALKELKENNWYKHAIRVAVGYGSQVNEKVLKKFTQNIEMVFHADTPIELSKIIKFTTLTASKVGSSNSKVNFKKDGDNTQKVAEVIKAKSGALNAKTKEEW